MRIRITKRGEIRIDHRQWRRMRRRAAKRGENRVGGFDKIFYMAPDFTVTTETPARP